MNVATINLKLFFSQTIHFSRSHFSRIFNKIKKFQYFSRTGKTVVISPGFPGAVGTLKIRPFHDMHQNRFKLVYIPECELLDCCAYKGHLCFCLCNPQKPNKFHIKLFQVNEALSGNILGFKVYTGKQSASVADQATLLDVTCTRTTKLVLHLLASVDLLHEGHHYYMDNYYSSP